jgi:transcription elongation factor Elf1
MAFYKIARCPYCGFVQLTTAKATFRCLSCSRTRGLRQLEVLRSFDEFSKAHAYISEYKKQAARKQREQGAALLDSEGFS